MNVNIEEKEKILLHISSNFFNVISVTETVKASSKHRKIHMVKFEFKTVFIKVT